MTKSKLLHYFLAVGGVLAVLAPDLTSLAATLSGLGIGWLNWVAKGLGIAALIGSRWDVMRAKVQPLLCKPSSNTPVICALILGSLLIAGTARADFNLDDVAPRVTKCWGTTCVMPAASVNAVLFDLNTKTWQAGTTSLGAGLALLFMADSAWASGLTAHLTGVLAQEGPSFAMPTAGLVLARYFEVGYSYRFSEGSNTSYISVAGNIPWDLFTKATIPQRARAARAAMGQQ